VVPMGRIELPTSPLPRECSTTEPHGHFKARFEKDAGTEPSASLSRSDIEVCAAGDREAARKLSFSSSVSAVITVTHFVQVSRCVEHASRLQTAQDEIDAHRC
jgi:hypothetical protein